MRIGIEGLPLMFHRTGTSTYTHELVQHLRRLSMGDQVILFARNQRSKSRSYHGISYWERAANLLYKEYRLPGELAQQRIDIYHSPRDMGLPFPPRVHCPTVITLHDIILVRLGHEYYHPAQARLYRRRLRSRIEQADHVITISNFSRDDILDWTDLDPAKVSVIYNGVSERFRQVTDEKVLEDVRNKYGLPRRFILCVGSTEPRKNIRQAMLAFAELRRTEPTIGLVITGVDYCNIAPSKAFAGAPSEGVLLAGYVDDAHMPAVLSMAEVLFFPSLYEGFGLPPLEAMACGTPVVVSNTTSIPEIVEDAAILVNPRDIGEMAAALEMAAGSESLRSELIEKGRRRASVFTWNKCAWETRELYRRVLEHKK